MRMIELARQYILLRNSKTWEWEAKTSQIESMEFLGNRKVRIAFKNKRQFTYNQENVIRLAEREWIDPANHRVARASTLFHDVADIWRLNSSNFCSMYGMVAVIGPGLLFGASSDCSQECKATTFSPYHKACVPQDASRVQG